MNCTQSVEVENIGGGGKQHPRNQFMI